MNDQVILSVAKKNGGLEVTTGGTGQDQLNAIRVAAAATFRVLHGARNLPEEMAAGVISAAVLDGIQEAMRNDGGMREITLERSRKLGGAMREKKNLRRVTLLVTAQTAYNLDRLATMCGYREPGHVVDKLVREKMLELNGGKRHERNEN